MQRFSRVESWSSLVHRLHAAREEGCGCREPLPPRGAVPARRRGRRGLHSARGPQRRAARRRVAPTLPEHQVRTEREAPDRHHTDGECSGRPDR